MFATTHGAYHPTTTTGASYTYERRIDGYGQYDTHCGSEHALCIIGSAELGPYPAVSVQRPSNVYANCACTANCPATVAAFPSALSPAFTNGWAPSYAFHYPYNYSLGYGSSTSSIGSPLQSNAFAISSFPSSPASGYGQHTNLSISSSPTSTVSTYTPLSSSQHSPLPEAEAYLCTDTTESKPETDSAMHVFTLSTLEPIDASHDPYPVSMVDLMYCRDDIEYDGLSYSFALPESMASAAAPIVGGTTSREVFRLNDCNVSRIRRTTRSSPVKRREIKVKWHTCEVCAKSFPRPSGLRTHMNIHSGARPFPCPQSDCKKRFTVRSNALRHFRTHSVVPKSRTAQGYNGKIKFVRPIVAENIFESRVDGRNMRLECATDRPGA